jgi:hypothetical protein
MVSGPLPVAGFALAGQAGAPCAMTQTFVMSAA